MKNQKIQICDVTVHPGEVANLALPMPEQYSCSPLYMPIKVIHGHQVGKCLVIFSVLNGIELNGLEIANRVVKLIDPKDICGTIIAIPVMNVFGLTHYPSRLPNGRDLASCFPGKEAGSYGERMAYSITHEILNKSDYCIELQTGDLNHNILPQIYCNFEDRKSKELAKVFKTPVVSDVQMTGNNLRQTIEALQAKFFVYQAGEAMRFDENVIMLGALGIKNFMRAIGMLIKAPNQEFTPIFSKDENWVVAHKGGILHSGVTLGQTIQKGEVIGAISDPFGAGITESVKSLQKGVVVGVNTAPLIHEGLPIFKIASFLDCDKAETTIEAWDKSQPDSYIG